MSSGTFFDILSKLFVDISFLLVSESIYYLFGIKSQWLEYDVPLKLYMKLRCNCLALGKILKVAIFQKED